MDDKALTKYIVHLTCDIADYFGLHVSTIYRRLGKLGYRLKLDHWVPYDKREADEEEEDVCPLEGETRDGELSAVPHYDR